MRPIRCLFGFHYYEPDRERGPPYIICERCGKRDVFCPPPFG